MRILLINKFLRPKGGTETVFRNEYEWLTAAGHEVIPFGMAHPHNMESEYARYWVPTIDYNAPTPRQIRQLIWSPEAEQHLRRLLHDTKPDVAHLHNIYHQLSPSILAVLAEEEVPAFLTTHDYKLICPNYKLYANGGICTLCVNSHTRHALTLRCHKDSYLASGLVALESALHRRWQAYDSVQQLIAPSRFMHDWLVKGGISNNKITVIPHALEVTDVPKEDAGKFMLFVGRLTEEKGLRVLLSAARQLRDVRFVIAGDGPLRDEILETAPVNVEWVGWLSKKRVWAKCRQARALIVPSLWYEVFGMSALESMAMGTPVIASQIGGLPEIIQHQQTGLLVPPHNAPELATAIDQLWHRPDFALQLGTAAQNYVREHHHPQTHLQRLLSLFT